MDENVRSDEFNPYGQPQTLEEGENFILVQGLRCFQVFTKDGHQMFGTHDLTAAKKKFARLETQSREGA